MQNKTFRLFISSTFSDFTKEREILHEKVFPKIDNHCNKNGFSFQPIDLRWGVSNEAQLDQKTLEVCLEEVRACKHFPHPNFLIMAGDRYGYIPCPYMIEKDELEKIKSVTINEEELKTLEYWYKLDLNQIYITNDNKESTAYILQSRIDEYIEYPNWEKQENLLRDILQNGADKTFDNKEDKEYKKYFLSATEAEVIEGILDYSELTSAQKSLIEKEDKLDEKFDKEFVYGYTRTIKGANGLFVDFKEEPKKKADEFKENISKTLDNQNNILSSNFSSVGEYETNELKEFEVFIYNKLIESIALQKENQQAIPKLDQEILEQKKFQQDKLKGFQGRKNTLDKIKSYIDIESNYPFVIHGPSGMGKSSLVSKAIEDVDINFDNIVYRFVGATQNSTTIRNLLISITDQLIKNDIVKNIEEYESDENKFYEQIKETLQSINNQTIIFVDALDQLQYKEHLIWLPEKLPNNLKIILSVLNDENYQQDSHYYDVLKQRHDSDENFIDISKDSLETSKDSIIKNLLKSLNRKLDDYQTDYLLKKWKETNFSPLYLKIAIEEVKHWRYGDKTQKLESGIKKIILEFIKNLTLFYHHENLLVQKVFGYIYSSKDGISEKELLEILSEDLEDEIHFNKAIINEWHKPIKVKNLRRNNIEEHTLPVSVWSRLHTLVKPFIIERNVDNQPLMKFFHRQFTTQIEYLLKVDTINFHKKLLNYFLDSSDHRKAIETIYHAYKIKDSEQFFDLLFNEKILLINIEKGNLYQLVDFIKNINTGNQINVSFKKNYYSDKITNIKYFENLRYVAYLIGNIKLEEEVLNLWEEYVDKLNMDHNYILYKSLADLHFRMGNSNKSIDYSDLAKTYVNNDFDLLDLNLSLVRLYTFTGNIIKANNIINEIQKSKIEDNLSINKKAEYYQELSFPFHDMDSNSMFASYNKKAKDIYKIIDSKYDYCIAGVNEGDGYWGSGLINQAHETLEESLNKSIEWNIDHAIDISYICYSNLQSSRSNEKINLENYEKGIALAKEIGHDWDEIYGSIYYNLAKAETLNVNSYDILIELSVLAKEKEYTYLSELALSYALLVCIFHGIKNKTKKEIDSLSANSAKLYHLTYELLFYKHMDNINEIFKIIDIVDGVKGRPYIVYFVLVNYSDSLSLEQKNQLQIFKKKCYIDNSLPELYRKRINQICMN